MFNRLYSSLKKSDILKYNILISKKKRKDRKKRKKLKKSKRKEKSTEKITKFKEKVLSSSDEDLLTNNLNNFSSHKWIHPSVRICSIEEFDDVKVLSSFLFNSLDEIENYLNQSDKELTKSVELLFRRNCNRVKLFKYVFEGCFVNQKVFSKRIIKEINSPNLLSNAIKVYLNQLSNPLLGFLYNDIVLSNEIKEQNESIKNEEVLLDEIFLLMKKRLKNYEMILLARLFDILNKTAKNKKRTKMSSKSLATLFCAVLLVSDVKEFVADKVLLKFSIRIIELLIDNYETIFLPLIENFEIKTNMKITFRRMIEKVKKRRIFKRLKSERLIITKKMKKSQRSKTIGDEVEIDQNMFKPKDKENIKKFSISRSGDRLQSVFECMEKADRLRKRFREIKFEIDNNKNVDNRIIEEKNKVVQELRVVRSDLIKFHGNLNL